MLVTDFATYKPAVANMIPAQTAGRIAGLAGVADRSGWCPIDPTTFESKLQPKIHVIGDAAIAGAMPNSPSPRMPKQRCVRRRWRRCSREPTRCSQS